MKYMPRIVDTEIEELMQIMGAILIEGCKWCGKSTTGEQHAKSVTKFQDTDKKNEYDEIKDTKPSLFLLGDKPKLFDEWQMYPIIWDTIRMNVDETGLKGEYILTGSAKPKEDNEITHTGTGRFARIKMRTMSLYESGESTGEVSLSDIIKNQDISGSSNLSLEDIASVIVRGGWPDAVKIKNDLKYRIAKEYVKSLVYEEIKKNDKIERNPEKMLSLLKCLARNISTPVSYSTLENDVKNTFKDNISRPTLTDYINTLEKLFVIENIPATKLEFCSKTALRTKPKREFVDPSIATAVLSLTPDDLIQDLRTFGFLFEALCIRDLKVYSETFGGELSFYLDEKDFEVDAILKTPKGWGAIEIKLGAGKIEEAANNLLKFKDKVKEKPLFLMVLTGASYSYKREDGVYVVSIGTLKN